MVSSRLFIASAVSLGLVAGCQSTDVLSREELDMTVAAMTRSDVTRPPGEGSMARPSVDVSQGYREALRTAVLENPEFVAAVRRYKGSDAAIRVAQSGLRPQVSATFGAGGLVEDGESGVTSAAAADVTLSQLIFDGGRTRADIAGATAQAYAARANIAVAGNEVGQAAAQAWIDLWQVNAQIALLNERISEVSPLIGRIERLIANGIVDRASLAAAQRQFLDLKLEEERFQSELSTARDRFNRYYGERPRSIPAPNRLFTDSEISAMSNSWQDSPALIAAAAELIAAERAVDAAKAQLRPRVSLRSGINSPLQSSSNQENATLGISLEHTFGDGGRRKAEIERRTEQLEAGRSAFEDTKNSTLVEVENVLAEHQSLRETITILDSQIRELDTERNTLRSQITSGQADIRQIVETEVIYYRARARRIAVSGQLISLEIIVASLTGQLIDKLAIDVDGLL